MRRKLFIIAVVVSLVLCGVFALLWPLNRTYHEYVTYGRPLDANGERWLFNLTADANGVALTCAFDHRTDPSYQPLLGWRFVARPYPSSRGPFKLPYQVSHSLLGFTYAHEPRRIGYQRIPVVTVNDRALTVPYWFLIVVTLLLPAIALHRWHRRRRRIGENRCLTCGYDLRASPERCPECGAIPLQP